MILNIKEENELYLEFNDIRHLSDHVSLLDGAFLYGNILSNQVINIDNNDEIILDFSKQHSILGPYPEFFMAKLKWGKVEFIEKDKIIKLDDCVLEYKKIGVLKELTKNNFFIIDVAGHTEQTHHSFLTYKCYVLDEQGIPVD